MKNPWSWLRKGVWGLMEIDLREIRYLEKGKAMIVKDRKINLNQKGAPIFIKNTTNILKSDHVNLKIVFLKRDWSLQIGPRKLKKSALWSLKSPEILRKVTTNAKSLTFIVKRVPKIEKCLVLNLLKLRNFDQKLHLNLKNLTNQNPLNLQFNPQHPLIHTKDQDLDFRSLLNQSDLKLDYQQVTIALSTQYPKSSTSTLQKVHPLLTTTNTPSQTYKSGSTSPNFEHFLDFNHFVKTLTPSKIP